MISMLLVVLSTVHSLLFILGKPRDILPLKIQ